MIAVMVGTPYDNKRSRLRLAPLIDPAATKLAATNVDAIDELVAAAAADPSLWKRL